jgi:hypothetical protein
LQKKKNYEKEEKAQPSTSTYEKSIPVWMDIKVVSRIASSAIQMEINLRLEDVSSIKRYIG